MLDGVLKCRFHTSSLCARPNKFRDLFFSHRVRPIPLATVLEQNLTAVFAIWVNLLGEDEA
jgi:hypothetical protein